ncbi:MAG: hypothetical protein JWM41_3820 [Gemmatimonadetes bacterium]|nr:hypothetical protein [Gemmatimonadota bacterium]
MGRGAANVMLRAFVGQRKPVENTCFTGLVYKVKALMSGLQTDECAEWRAEP